MTTNETLYVTISPKTHYWRGENNTLHITSKDLFATCGEGWFNNAHRYEDTRSIKVKNCDTGGVVQFAFYTAVQSQPTSYLNRKHRMISYKATLCIAAELCKVVDLYLMVWENAGDLAAYRQYMTEKEGVTSN